MKTKTLTLSLLGGALLFSALGAFAQERDVYFNPNSLTGDINWGDISWSDSLGDPTTAPDADSNVFLSGPRAGSYRHVIIPAGSDITVNKLTLANSGWAGNNWRTLDIVGTSENRVNFTATNGVTIAENFNSLYAAYTNFKSGAISLPYYGRLDLTQSTIAAGQITGGNVTTIAFDSTTGTVDGINVSNGGVTNITNGSAITLKVNDFYTGGTHTLTVSDSSFTVEKNFIVTSNATLNFTAATVDINTGMRFSSGTLMLNATDSAIIVRDGTYGGGTTTAIAVGDGQAATINLVNSTIETALSDSIDIRNASSEINISMMDEADVAITTGVLNFTGILTIDFAGMNLTEDKYFTLISATNAGVLFDALNASGNIIVDGLAVGESYAWDVTSGSIGIHFYAIPEPSTYAAIFGALALAFAVYRRRK